LPSKYQQIKWIVSLQLIAIAPSANPIYCTGRIKKVQLGSQTRVRHSPTISVLL